MISYENVKFWLLTESIQEWFGCLAPVFGATEALGVWTTGLSNIYLLQSKTCDNLWAVVWLLLGLRRRLFIPCVLYHYIIETAINKGVMIRATKPVYKKYDGAGAEQSWRRTNKKQSSRIYARVDVCMYGVPRKSKGRVGILERKFKIFICTSECGKRSEKRDEIKLFKLNQEPLTFYPGAAFLKCGLHFPLVYMWVRRRNNMEQESAGGWIRYSSLWIIKAAARVQLCGIFSPLFWFLQVHHSVMSFLIIIRLYLELFSPFKSLWILPEHPRPLWRRQTLSWRCGVDSVPTRLHCV
jgi:hypothetical protein